MDNLRIQPQILQGQLANLRRFISANKSGTDQNIIIARLRDELASLKVDKFTVARISLDRELTDLYKGATPVVISLRGINKSIFKDVIANCLVNLTRQGKRVILCEPAEEIRNYLKRTKFDELFEVYDTEVEAQEAASTPTQ